MPLAARIDDALPPGLAAELAQWLPALPLGIETAPAGAGVWWSCEVAVPEVTDPQTPPCVVALLDFLASAVPAHLRSLTGRTFAPTKPRAFAVHTWKKGSFLDDAPTTPDEFLAILGLTGPRWPAEWGGTLELGEAGATELRIPGWNTLDLLDPATPRRMTLLTHHVAVLTVTATYAPA